MFRRNKVFKFENICYLFKCCITRTTFESPYGLRFLSSWTMYRCVFSITVIHVLEDCAALSSGKEVPQLPSTSWHLAAGLTALHGCRWLIVNYWYYYYWLFEHFLLICNSDISKAKQSGYRIWQILACTSIKRPHLEGKMVRFVRVKI